MSTAFLQYPRLLNHKRWCKNGDVPDATFLRDLVYAQNHIMACRRKVILRHPVKTFYGNGGITYGLTGTTNLWRTRFHSGYGAARLRFLLPILRSASSSAADPRIDIDVTVAGGATTTRTIRSGVIAGASDGPDRIEWRKPVVNISANTTYEILIKAIDYCRPLGVVIMEEATPTMTADYYHNFEPGIEQPIYDSTRQSILQGLSQLWRRNGSHLLGWTNVDKSGTWEAAPTYASTTWTNVVDAATSVSSSSAGYYLGDTSYLLDKWCRLSDSNTLDVVLAVYGSMSAGSTGEVRLEDSTGTRCSITGIGTTAQWYTTTTTISNCDTLGKVDLQARTSNVANTLTLRAVSLYTYLA